MELLLVRDYGLWVSKRLSSVAAIWSKMQHFFYQFFGSSWIFLFWLLTAMKGLFFWLVLPLSPTLDDKNDRWPCLPFKHVYGWKATVRFVCSPNIDKLMEVHKLLLQNWQDHASSCFHPLWRFSSYSSSDIRHIFFIKTFSSELVKDNWSDIFSHPDSNKKNEKVSNGSNRSFFHFVNLTLFKLKEVTTFWCNP